MRILLIDDDPAVRNALARLLATRHDVRTASSHDEALAALAEDARLDAVVCDVVMPDHTGLDVLAAIRARFPGLARRVLLITGGSISRTIDEGVEASGAPVLRKPFTFAELESALATLVAGA